MTHPLYGSSNQRQALQVVIQTLELAKGFSGWFHRRVEPAVMLGCYAVSPRHIRPIGRCLARFHPKGDFPETTSPHDPKTSAVTASITSDSPIQVVVLAIAVEIDGGQDLQRLYGALDNPEALSVWAKSSETPSPYALRELGTDPSSWTYPTRCHLLVNGSDCAQAADSDKWIGAKAWVVTIADAGTSHVRLHFQSADAANDWTAVVAVHVGPGWA